MQKMLAKALLISLIVFWFVKSASIRCNPFKIYCCYSVSKNR